jgi:hypothetical protein
VIAGAAISAAAIYGMRRGFGGSLSSRRSVPIMGAQAAKQ